MQPQSGFILDSPEQTARQGKMPGFSSQVALLGEVQRFTAEHYFRTYVLTDSVNAADQVVSGATYRVFSWPIEEAQVARLVLNPTGNTSLLTVGYPNNRASGRAEAVAKDGGTYLLMVKQPSVGNRQLLFNSSVFKFPSNVEPTISTAPNAMTIISFLSDGTFMYGSALFNYTTT